MTAILIDLTVKATTLLVVAAVAARLMHRASAASRHMVWTGTFAAMLLLPMARIAVPAIRIPVLDGNAVREAIPEEALPEGTTGTSSKAAAPPGPALTSPSPLIAATHSAQPPSWSPSQVIVGVWLVGAGLICLRTLVGMARARRGARRAQVLADEWIQSRVEEIRRYLRVRRQIRILVSDDQEMPITWGVLRPVILLPSGAVAWGAKSFGKLDAVLVHETAHIARWDALSQAVARLAVAMLWFNPLFWIAARRARFERERACDDAVLAMGARPAEYAGHLVAVVRSLAGPAAALPHGLAMARRSQLERRIDAILDERVNRRGVSGASLLLAFALVALMLPCSAVRLTARELPAGSAVASSREVIVRAAQDQLRAPAEHPSDRATWRPALVHQGVPRLAHAPASTPRPLQSSGQDRATSPLLTAWRAEREAMLRQLLDRAQQHLKDVKVRIEIGTSAPNETADAAGTIAELERALLAEQSRTWIAAPSEGDMAAVRQRFAEALRTLNAGETRFDVGLWTIQQLDASVLAALDVLRESLPTAVTSSAEAPLTDAGLIKALQNAAAITSDTDRASALLSIAQDNALTPDMVALYVAAATSIASDAERARVFAQPIRIKPPRR